VQNFSPLYVTIRGFLTALRSRILARQNSVIAMIIIEVKNLPYTIRIPWSSLCFCAPLSLPPQGTVGRSSGPWKAVIVKSSFFSLWQTNIENIALKASLASFSSTVNFWLVIHIKFITMFVLLNVNTSIERLTLAVEVVIDLEVETFTQKLIPIGLIGVRLIRILKHFWTSKWRQPLFCIQK